MYYKIPLQINAIIKELFQYKLGFLKVKNSQKVSVANSKQKAWLNKQSYMNVLIYVSCKLYTHSPWKLATLTTVFRGLINFILNCVLD